MSVKVVILAEDNDKLRRLYSDALISVGINVMGATDGEKAVSLLHKVPNPSLIVLDVMMPRMNGIETCLRMRKMQGLQPCPIIFLSALDSPENILECLQAGGDDYVMKSAPLSEFLGRVQYWSRRNSPEEGSLRRTNAIKELQILISPGGSGAGSAGFNEASHDPKSLNCLAAFIESKAETFGESDDALYRFGYMVGLVETRVPGVGECQDEFSRFLRNLAFKTTIVERKSVEPLLENYTCIINQSQFHKGWQRGCDEAVDVEFY